MKGGCEGDEGLGSDWFVCDSGSGNGIHSVIVVVKFVMGW